MDLVKMGENAVKAKYDLQDRSTEEKNTALLKIAERLEENAAAILSANRKDIRAGEEGVKVIEPVT